MHTSEIVLSSDIAKHASNFTNVDIAQRNAFYYTNCYIRRPIIDDRKPSKILHRNQMAFKKWNTCFEIKKIAKTLFLLEAIKKR